MPFKSQTAAQSAASRIAEDIVARINARQLLIVDEKNIARIIEEEMSDAEPQKEIRSASSDYARRLAEKVQYRTFDTRKQVIELEKIIDSEPGAIDLANAMRDLIDGIYRIASRENYRDFDRDVFREMNAADHALKIFWGE